MRILAIETSCDETATAIVEDGTKILSNIVATSHEMHEKYGGIVPEIAAREQLRCIIPTIEKALSQTSNLKLPHLTSHFSLLTSQIDAIAVTVGPGLIGSLLIGVETAKTMAMVTEKPLIPVNHVLAHMYANFVRPEQNNEKNKLTIQQYNNITITFPAISLVVSGGHTELYLMESEKKLTWLGGTLDDAAGECFDKAARLLGFGHEGGVAIQKNAKKSQGVKLPRPLMYDKTLNFSFSGLKTAIMREWAKKPDQEGFAYEVQEAITDVLVKKTLIAAEKNNAKSILLSGGVSSNLRLREKFMIHNSLFTIHVPPVNLCTDNAVYIASYAFFRGTPVDWHEITAVPDLSVEV